MASSSAPQTTEEIMAEYNKYKHVSDYVTGSEAVRLTGLSQQTLRRYADNGQIEYIRSTPGGGKRLYNVKKFLGIHEKFDKKGELVLASRKVCYCRVSTHGQADDLTRQVEYMSVKYPNHDIIKDIGSGINFKRPGFLKILDMAIEGHLSELVLTYKDRMCRIGYDLVEYLLTKHSNTKIIIENQEEESTPEVEISNDILQIMTVYVAKTNGMRSHKNSPKIDKK